MFLANPFDDPAGQYISKSELALSFVETNVVVEGYNFVVQTIAKAYRPHVQHLLLCEQEDNEAPDADAPEDPLESFQSGEGATPESPNFDMKVLPAEGENYKGSPNKRFGLDEGDRGESSIFPMPLQAVQQVPSGVFRQQPGDGSPRYQPENSPNRERKSPPQSPRQLRRGATDGEGRGDHYSRRRSVFIHKDQMAVVADNVKFLRKNLNNNLRERQRKCAVVIVSLPRMNELLDQDHVLAHEYIIDFVRTVTTVMESFDGLVFQITPSEIRGAWNAHVPHASPQMRACEFALELHRQMFTSKRKELYSKHHITIDSGKVTHGVLSGNAMSAPIVFGHCTESVTLIHTIHRVLGTHILITDRVFEIVQSRIKARIVDVVLTGDTSSPMAIYELLPHSYPDALLKVSSQCFQSFRQHRFVEAKALLADQLSGSYDPQTARLFRLASYFSSNPAECLSKPYCRRYLGWLDIEASSSNEVLPGAAAPVLSEDDHYEELARSFTRRVCFSAAESYLRSEISKVRRSQSEIEREELERAALSPSPLESRDHPSLSLSSIDAAVSLSCFTDAKGTTWRCSEKTLGKGAFGEVRLGMGTAGELVAMKLLRIPPTEEEKPAAARGRRKGPNIEGEIEGLVKEVGLMTKMRHENVVSFMSCAVVGTYMVIVSEFVSGGSLMGLLQDFGKIQTTQVKRYIRDVLKGLRFLHSNHVVHLDIKPHNVLVMIDGQCKLTDFGASAQLSKELMQAQGVHGTPLYMAPEQCKGKAGPKSDVWGVGIMAFQLLTGTVPYTVDNNFNSMGFMFRLGNDPNFGPHPIGEYEMAEDSMNFITRCLVRDIEARPSAEDLLEDVFLS